MAKPPPTPPTSNYFEYDTPFPPAPPRYVAGGTARKLNYPNSPDSMQDFVKGSGDPNFSSASETSENMFLGIPQFLYYPQDLGTNPRYHHFVVFNIYRGESDEVRLDKRKQNLAESAISSKGLDAPAILVQNRDEIRKTLEDAGASTGDIENFINRIGAENGFGLSGDVLGTQISTLGNNLKSIFGVSGAGAANIGIDAATEFSSLEQIAVALKDVFFAGVEGGQETLDFITQSNTQYPDVDENQIGVTEKKINKKKYEQSILVANRRFNNANVKSKDTICLYMPLKFTINDNLMYGEEEMGGTKLLASAATNQRGGVSALIERALIRGAVDKIGGVVGQFTGEDINIAGVRSAMRRNAANPRREMLFKDVAMRTHTFDFAFSPKNEKEADAVLNIIKMFRFHAYPELSDKGGHFFEFPAEFEMAFYTISKDGSIVVNDNLPKLPRLALTAISVDYSGAGEFKTFEDAKPAFITLNLSFSEMEQLTSEHIIHGY